ncbi:structural maintenance of chromosomes protein 5, partial [Lampetra fluviatilis]
LECDARRFQDAVGQRVERLSHRSPHSAEACRWLENNRHRFHGAVHQPIALTLTPRDESAACFLENHISANDLRAFVFETREDMETFLRVMRDEQRLKVNAVRAPPKKPEDFHPRTPLSQISQPPYGFYSYLRELFDVPPLVMSFLCEHYHVHDVPVGTETTTANLEKVLSDLPLRQFYTTMSQYRMCTSRYTGDLVLSDLPLRQFYTTMSQYRMRTSRYTGDLVLSDLPLRQFYTTMSQYRMRTSRYTGELVTELTREAATLRDGITALTDTLRDLALRDNLLRDSKRRLDEKRSRRAALERDIRLKESTIDALRVRSVSLDEEVAASNQRVLKLHAASARTLRKYAEALQTLLTQQQGVVVLEVQIGELAQSHGALSASLAESTRTLQAAQAELSKLQDEKRRLYQVCRALLLKSKEVCGLGPDDEAPPEMQQALEGGPETLDEIDAAIEDARTRAALLNINPQVLVEFENRRVSIEELQGEVETLRQTLEEQQRHVDTVKPQWLEPLGLIVSQINAKFSSYLKTLDCAGEVDLYTDNQEDYAGYGLRVRVKFRSEESLQELTAHRQSGGERGVCTALYLMALQSLHSCPLRVMDEINQVWWCVWV